jgi:hypothetical protein
MNARARCSRRSAFGLVVLVAAVPLAAQGPPRVAVVYEERAAADVQLQIVHLCQALLDAEAAGRVARELRPGDRAVAITVTDARPDHLATEPKLPALLDRAGHHDAVICVGSRALMPFLAGPPLPPRVRLYALGVPGLAYADAQKSGLPNLDRLRGGVAPDVALAEIVRRLPELLAAPSPVGAVLGAGVPESMVTAATKAAKAAGIELRVQRVAEPRGYRAAVEKLVAGGCRRIAWLMDPGGAASPAALFGQATLRLGVRAEGVAWLVDAATGAAGHCTFAPDVAAMTARLCRMVADDRLGLPAPGVLPAPTATVTLEAERCRRDGIELLPAAKPGR